MCRLTFYAPQAVVSFVHLPSILLIVDLLLSTPLLGSVSSRGFLKCPSLTWLQKRTARMIYQARISQNVYYFRA
ncbi:hypothetical protein BO94DRAFT_233497 [Aspergillus sclerotioniger CBS 115572]|uniref:Uncharacterized protein n=1 Tax=Aspergillus sclerotioniger CBS 115572 TaxID=1450535 RepID=A0A317VKY6_9EURO|nr:hypothetical protein BO94DRAFT_233497 [Aspergillus sclerotioniger CBS 115572]PWY73777.1 hypothetical protein BO94DRAFT_233497 [Aspergillus sclerotioniger CBS 115572]